MNLGKFEIIEEIGHGGFGTVYRANDTTLDRIVALKILHEQYLSDHKFIESFKREARMMAKVSHPNVVQIFEVGDLEGHIYIAMQYFDGGNLDQKIQAGGPLPLKDAIRMLSQTARGLEAGHKLSLVHRDVKPANILYNREGYIAISDFGVAKSIQQSSPETTNSFNQFAGTPYYIPPELWQSEGNPSPAADVYSLACVFYEALTGEILFAGDTYEHVLTRHVLEAPVFSPTLPDCLADTLTIALAKNPSDRYQTMNDFLAAVRGALERQSRKTVPTKTTPEESNLVEGLPKPLATGEITFDELVRRAQYKSTNQNPNARPAPFSQPTPAPIKPTVPTAQPQQQKIEPEPERRTEAPAVVPIIRPPQKNEQPPEPNAEEKRAPEAFETEPVVGLPEIAAEQCEELDNEVFSEDESVEDFFTLTSSTPLETEELELLETQETPPTEDQDDDLIPEDWLTKHPALDDASIPGDTEDAPQVLQEEAAVQKTAETAQFPLPQKIVGGIVDETPADAEQIIPLKTPSEKDQNEPTPEPLAVATQPSQVQLNIAEAAAHEVPIKKAVSASQMAVTKSQLENELVLETTSDLPQSEQSITPTEDKLSQTLKEREGLLTHNAATSRFVQSQKKETEREPQRKSKFILMLAFGGIALIALAFLALSGQAGSLFGGKPSSTPTFTLTLLPSNTAAAPVIIPTRTHTSTTASSSTKANTQISATATFQTPTSTAAATSTPYPTAKPTDRPTNPPVVTTAPPVITTAPPIVTTAPPTNTSAPPIVTTQPPVVTTEPPVVTTEPPVVTTEPPVVTTEPPTNTPVPTRGPTPTPP
jgi:serine/threonine-protein kinase